jgi:hypothetical protein
MSVKAAVGGLSYAVIRLERAKRNVVPRVECVAEVYFPAVVGEFGLDRYRRSVADPSSVTRIKPSRDCTVEFDPAD